MIPARLLMISFSRVKSLTEVVDGPRHLVSVRRPLIRIHRHARIVHENVDARLDWNGALFVKR